MAPLNKPLCFMHVPKSAGSSVRIALERAVSSEAISPKWFETSLVDAGVKEFERLDRARFVVVPDEVEQLADYHFVIGHFQLSTLLRITDASSIATVLREPRSRLLSQYAYFRLASPELRSEWAVAPGLSHALRPLDECLAEPQVAYDMDNTACRMLLGDDAQIPETGFIREEDVKALASRAIGAIRALGFVGIVELGERMWDGLSRFFGVSLVPLRVHDTGDYSATSDTAAASFQISPRTLELLEARTAVDSIIYRHALGAVGWLGTSAERVAAAAFADELVRLGNAVGSSATEWRSAARTVGELTEELGRKDDVLTATETQLRRAQDELRDHRAWLDGIQGSASWRLTAPVRAAKRRVKGARTALRRPTAD